MEKKTVYLETSVVSYLTNRPSRDLIVAAHQTVTREWWESRRADFALYVSEPVLDEAGAGDPEAAAKRLSVLNDIEVLSVTDEAIEFAARLLQQGDPRESRDRCTARGACLHQRHPLSAYLELHAHRQCRALRRHRHGLLGKWLQIAHYLYTR